MSKMKKLLWNPTLFLYDLCAKRLGKQTYYQENIAKLNELIDIHRKQSEYMLAHIKKDEERYNNILREVDVLLKDNLSNKNIDSEVKDISLKIEKLNSGLFYDDHNIAHTLQRIEPILNKRFPLPYNDIRFALVIKTALECADFIQKYMQQDGIPFPWRSRKDLLLYSAAQTSLNGLILEFGVYRGISIGILASFFKDRMLYGFDSFEGLPETWRPGFEKGAFALESLPAVPANVSLIKGWFKDTLPDFLKKHSEPVAFLHVDCDLYSSTKDVFTELTDRIVPGTVILFDEFYNYTGWEHGEYKAFSEFITATGKSFSYIGYSQQQVAVIIK